MSNCPMSLLTLSAFCIKYTAFLGPLNQLVIKDHIISIISLHNQRHTAHTCVAVLKATLKVPYLTSS